MQDGVLIAVRMDNYSQGIKHIVLLRHRNPTRFRVEVLYSAALITIKLCYCGANKFLKKTLKSLPSFMAGKQGTTKVGLESAMIWDLTSSRCDEF